MDSPGLLTISGLATGCATSLDALVQWSNNDEHATLMDSLEDEQGRFRVWASNIGALHRENSPSSLDSRLEDASRLRGSVMEALKRVQSTIDRCQSILDGELPNRTTQNLGKATSIDPETELEPTSELEQLLLNMHSSISHLFSLSTLIRRGRPKDRLPRPDSFVALESSPDIKHVEDKFPKAKKTPWLAQRLGNAITQRREVIQYRQTHRSRLAKVVAREGDGAGPAGRDQPLGAMATPFGEMKQSDVDQPGDRSSVLTSSKSVTSADENDVGRRIPDLSKMRLDGVELHYGEPIECPYCRTIQTLENKFEWRSHVFSDLQPYVCTFENCTAELFATRQQWFSHETDVHRRQWACIHCDESSTPFNSATALKEHFQASHMSNMTENQLSTIVEACQWPPKQFSSSDCPLCDGWEPPAVESQNTEKFCEHLARHQQILALEGLPIAVDGLELSSPASGSDSIEAPDDPNLCQPPGSFFDIASKGFQDGRDTTGRPLPKTQAGTSRSSLNPVSRLSPDPDRYLPIEPRPLSAQSPATQPPHHSSPRHQGAAQPALLSRTKTSNMYAATADLADFLENNVKIGRNGFDQCAKYIPSSVLRQYWSEARLRDAFFECNLRENSDDILKNFLRVFSILVYIGEPRAIERFRSHGRNDHHLPMGEFSGHWLKMPDTENIYEDFLHQQWMFCPQELHSGFFHHRHLPAPLILPVESMERLSEEQGDGGYGVVYKVRIDGEENYNIPNTVAFKVYQTDEADDLYKAEADAYSRFDKEHGDYISRCFGTFEQNGKRTIVLEWASGGTLLDFLSRTLPPQNKDQVKKLWTRLSRLVHGLAFIHGIPLTDDGSESVLPMSSRTHYNIKPDNILVFPQNDSDPYNVTFKFADFGTSHPTKAPAINAQNALRATKNGSRMYSAPESTCMLPVQKYIPSKVEPAADVWALGAVFSEILTWTIGGEYFRDEYCHRREFETSKSPSLRGGGYGGAFHDGESRLSVVEQIHDDALRTRPKDGLSRAISNLILAHMLQIEDHRRKPIDIAKLLEQELHRPSHTQVSPQSPALPPGVTSRMITTSPWLRDDRQILPSPTTSVEPTRLASDSQNHFPRPQTVHGPRHPLAPPQGIQLQAGLEDFITTPPINRANTLVPASSTLPEAVTLRPSETFYSPSVNPVAPGSTLPINQQRVSFERAYLLLTRKQARLQRSSTFKRFVESRESRKLAKAASEEMKLPGIQEALSTLQSLGKREQVILIDDFASMEKHKSQVQAAARVISYYVKEVDPNKMELYFASEINKLSEYDRSSALETAIHNHAFVPGQCSMRLYLGNILRSIMAKPTFRAKPSSIYVLTDAVWEPGEARVDMVIADAARQLRNEGLPPEHIMIQFIRFGDSDLGKARLNHLDDDIVQAFQLGDYDIVDAKSFEDSVPDVLVGSISRFNDSKVSYP